MGYFPLNETSQQYFLENVSEFEDPLIRGSIWIALYEDLLRGNGLSPEDFFSALLRHLPQEMESLNQNNLLNKLPTVYWRFLSDTQRSSFAEGLEQLLKTGWMQAEDSNKQTGFFRQYYQLATSTSAIEELFSIWKGETEVKGLRLSESDRIDIAA